MDLTDLIFPLTTLTLPVPEVGGREYGLVGCWSASPDGRQNGRTDGEDKLNDYLWLKK